MSEGASRPAVLTRQVSKRFGRQWALRRASLSLDAGQLHVVIGHNGAGKSTLLGLLAGAMRPTEGQVEVLGQTLEGGGPSLRQRIAWLPHTPFVYPDLSGRESLAFVAGLYGRGADAATLDAALERVQLGAAGHRKVRTYSRGMTQRLALAAVMVQSAEVWLLDEPATGLDVAGREMLLELLREAKGAGACIVVVTHDPSAFAPVTDSLYRLERARITQVEVG